MRKGLAIMLMCFLLALLSACDMTSQLEDSGWKPFSDKKEIEEKPIHYVSLGDSLTEGVGDEKERGGYVGRLAKDMQQWEGVKSVTVTNTAKKGRRSDQLLAQLESGEINDALKDADIITLTMGGNDIMKIVRQNINGLDKKDFDAALPAYEKRYEQIFHLIREQNKTAPIIAMGVYNPFTVYTTDVGDTDAVMAEYNAVMQKIVEQDNHYAVFVPINDLFVSNDKKVYHTDFFHPNAKGYRLIEKRIVTTLKTKDLYTLSKGNLDLEGNDDE
ncbi:SGNH/GDSL hydrolase family protein [Kurthia massiliensis]|uniref:SGNH/GDSL hydrolase family protein n=1 Tax=Kurthia massiliensis TaxID=1033739 RepID=UPI00028A24F9|nr:SGNH/GDSL hydrolase family protein [Kurthia massiliensis]